MTLRLGWITSEYPRRPSPRAVWLKSGAMLTMRYRNLALALNRYGFRSEFYRPQRHYDAVIVIKAFHEAVLRAVDVIQRQGIPLIFEANVNYYYIWGAYPDPKTQPSPFLRRAATDITRRADHVLADSDYLRACVLDLNPRVTWLPDNVSPLLFAPRRQLLRRGARAGSLRLIWSGMAFKSEELLLLQEVFACVKGLELWLVSEAEPSALKKLSQVLPVRWFRYHDWRYGALLGQADAILSPRQLNNGYNLGHTEYKISLGMARGLPALASPQPSYVRALAEGGGVICHDLPAWEAALVHLRDDLTARLQMGARAQATVQRYYATPVVARRLAELLNSLIQHKP